MKRRTMRIAMSAALSLGLLGGTAWAQEHVQHAGPSHATDEALHAPGNAPGADEAEADAEHHGGGTQHEGHEHGPAPINWTDFGNNEQPPYAAMLLNFALLVGLYWYVGRKPVAEALKNRRATVAKEIEEAQRMRKEAEERAVVYQEKLKNLEHELAETRQALVDAGKNERDRIVREAEEKAARMEKDATFLVEQEMKQLRQDLTRDAVQMAVAAAEELLKKRVTAVDQERLAEDYLAELAGKSRGPASIPPPPAPTSPGGAPRGFSSSSFEGGQQP